MVKWEYKELPMSSMDNLALFNQLGSGGWELVSISPGADSWRVPRAYFKRPALENALDAFDMVEKWEGHKRTKNAKGPFIKRNSDAKDLLFKFRSMVLELIEAGNMIPSEVKKKAYDLIDSCYDEDGELIA